jgi:hypothetical protein
VQACSGVLRIHPPPYQGRLPPSPSSSCIRQGLIHAVAYKAQSVDSSPIHNTSRPFHVHPPFVRSSSFQEVVAYPQASHPRSTSLHSSTRYPIRITNNTVKILLHPFIHPPIHPSIRSSSPPRRHVSRTKAQGRTSRFLSQVTHTRAHRRPIPII